MSDARTDGRSRSEMLKRLRDAHAASVNRTQALLREQTRMQQAICGFVRDAPKTVPEIAAAIGRPTHEVLWFVAALRKYGLLVEAGMCGDYPLYKRAEEVKA